MLEILIILGIAAIGVIFYQFIIIVFSPPKILPRLYLKVEKDVANIEWILRDFCRGLQNWYLVVIDHGDGENSLILDKLSMRYGYDLEEEIPEDAEYILEINSDTNIKELKKQLKIIEPSLKVVKKLGERKG